MVYLYAGHANDGRALKEAALSNAINANDIDDVEEYLMGGRPDLTVPRSPRGVDAVDGASASRTGTNGSDTILGGEGTDVINARNGEDRVAGGGGDDLLYGASGNDSLAGDGGMAPVGFPFPPSGDDTIVGGAGNDTIYGDSFFYNGIPRASNLVFGGAGDDAIIGGYGADTVSGGSGDDFISGDGPSPPTGGTGVESARSMDLGDLLFGGAGSDTINGAGGGDTMDGGAGDDRLVGDFGNDTMAGGPGADTFAFRFSAVSMSPDTGRGEGNRDVVTDFETGVDLLDLTGYRSPSVTWAYDQAGDRTIVTIVDPRAAFSLGPYEIELTGVRDLTADDMVLV